MSDNGEGTWSRKELLEQHASRRMEKIEYQNRPLWVMAVSLPQLLNRPAQADSEANILSTFVSCLCDKHGKPLFTEQDVSTIRETFPGVFIMHVFNTAWRLSGLTQGDFEELGKGLGATPSDVSPSGSRPSSTARSRN